MIFMMMIFKFFIVMTTFAFLLLNAEVNSRPLPQIIEQKSPSLMTNNLAGPTTSSPLPPPPPTSTPLPLPTNEKVILIKSSSSPIVENVIDDMQDEMERLNQLESQINQIRKKSKHFKHALRKLSPNKVLQLSDAELQHGTEQDVIALQHALLKYSQKVCRSGLKEINEKPFCLPFDGFPTIQHEQAYKSLTIYHILFNLPFSKFDKFLQSFLEHSSISDLEALERVLKISKNSRIEEMFGLSWGKSDYSGIIGKHMKKRSPQIEQNPALIHLHLHGEPLMTNNNIQKRSIFTEPQQDVIIEKRKFSIPLPQCALTKRSLEQSDNEVNSADNLQKRKNIQLPPECHGNMDQNQNHYTYNHNAAMKKRSLENHQNLNENDFIELQKRKNMNNPLALREWDEKYGDKPWAKHDGKSFPLLPGSVIISTPKHD